MFAPSRPFILTSLQITPSQGEAEEEGQPCFIASYRLPAPRWELRFTRSFLRKRSSCVLIFGSVAPSGDLPRDTNNVGTSWGQRERRGKRLFGGVVSLAGGTGGWMTDRRTRRLLGILVSALLQPRVETSVPFEPFAKGYLVSSLKKDVVS